MLLGGGTQDLQFLQQGIVVEGSLDGGLVGYLEGQLVVFEVQDTTVAVFGQVGGWQFLEGPVYESSNYAGTGDLEMRFWSTGAALSQKIGIFSPYLGIISMQSRWKLTGELLETRYFHQKYSIGPFLGTSIGTGPLLLNLEWRGCVENGISLAGEIRF